jgi:hypothetical protein
MSVKVIPPGFTTPQPADLTGDEQPSLDWQRLQRALQGRDVTIPRAQAVALIVASGRPDAPRTLARVLQDPAEPPRLRALTALSLPRLSSPTAEEVLIEATRVEDDTVLAAVMRALGRVGGERALRAIEAAKPTSTVAVQQAAFAAAFISHRLGLPGHDLREPPSRELLTLPDAAARPFRIQPVDAVETSRVVFDLAREGFRFDYDDRAVYEIRCANNRWQMVFTRDATGPDGSARLRERKALAAVWASYQNENKTFAARFLVLTAPGGKAGVRIHIHRLTGEPAFFGRARAEGEGLTFSLRAVDLPGAFPIAVEGDLTASGRLKLTRAEAALFVRTPRRPEPDR